MPIMNRTKVLISFDLPRMYIEKIGSISPSLEVLQSENKEEALLLIKDAEILFAGFFSKDLFLAGKKLKWIQSWGAGVDRLLFPEVVKSQIIVTNAGGVHPTPISEHVLGLMLCLCQKLHVFIRNQMERKWERYDSWVSEEQVEELSGKTGNSGARQNRNRNSGESKMPRNESDRDQTRHFSSWVNHR
jgi:phosphoglycerate dehydrogenase-like enzyme